MPPHKKSKLGAGCYERGERGAWRDYLVVDAAGCTHSFPVAARYRLTRPLGRGAFGSVVLARDQLEGRDVAIKTILLPSDASTRARLERELTILQQLQHLK